MQTGTAPQVTVNGEALALTGTDPCTNALDWLRSRGLTGAKEGCAEGECGACAVMVARPDGAGGTHWVAVNACLSPAGALAGQEVTTAEGLGTPEALHPVQSEMAVRGGSQCGYCTPGFICSMAAEYYRPDRQVLGGRRAPLLLRSRRGVPRGARPQRLRPRVDLGQPVPLHGVPPHPRRRVRARVPGGRRPGRHAGDRAVARPGPDPGRGAGRLLRPPRRPRRGAAPGRGSTPTRSSSRGRPTGASTSTSTAPAAGSSSASTASRSCGPWCARPSTSSSAPPSPSPSSSATSPAASRSSPPSSRSSPPP